MTTSMTPIPMMDGPHPAVAAALRVATEVEGVLALDPAFMRTVDKEAALLEWTRVVTLVEAERLRLMAVSADVADAHGARDVAVWLAHETHTDGAGARRDLGLASAIAARWSGVDDALA